MSQFTGNNPSTSKIKRCLEIREVTKDFPGVRALHSFSLEVNYGEILALLGGNGSGKSTLMKILSGVYPTGSYTGSFSIDGATANFRTPREARDAGIAIIHQELNVFPEMSVADNLFLTIDPINKMGLIKQSEKILKATEILSLFQININPEEPLKNFPVGVRQLIEICKAIHLNAKVLILDEPTSALTDRETSRLFEILKDLKKKGIALIYITHRMEEIFTLSDRVVVMRDGVFIKNYPTRQTEQKELITAMVGRTIDSVYPEKRWSQKESSQPKLRIRNISARSRHRTKNILNSISLDVCAGEIVGLAGLMGSGRTELLTTLFGSFDGITSGEIEINGKKVAIHSPQDAIRNRMALLTEDRKITGLLLERSVEDNMLITNLKQFARGPFVDRKKFKGTAFHYKDMLRIKTPSLRTHIKTLSGGNQQKVLLAKWLISQPEILFLDEPTRGIDVGARSEIYQLIDSLARQGMAILMASSDIPELTGMSDRVYVMREGQIVSELSGTRVHVDEVMHAAVGAVTR